MPSKLYGILAAGKPFVAAMEPWAEPALIAEEYGCGVNVAPRRRWRLAARCGNWRIPETSLNGGERVAKRFEKSFDRPVAVDAYQRVLAQELS